MARPSKYRKKYCKIAEDFIAKGHSKTALCAELGISRDTLYEWVNTKKEFSDSIKKGVERGLRMYEQLMISLATGQNVSRTKNVDKTALIFILKTRFHKEWGNREKLEVSNPDGSLKPRLDLNNLNDGEIKTLLDKISKVKSETDK